MMNKRSLQIKKHNGAQHLLLLLLYLFVGVLFQCARMTCRSSINIII